MAVPWSLMRHGPWLSALRAVAADGHSVKAEEAMAAMAEAMAASALAEIVILTAADETGATDSLLQ